MKILLQRLLRQLLRQSNTGYLLYLLGSQSAVADGMSASCLWLVSVYSFGRDTCPMGLLSFVVVWSFSITLYPTLLVVCFLEYYFQLFYFTSLWIKQNVWEEWGDETERTKEKRRLLCKYLLLVRSTIFGSWAQILTAPLDLSRGFHVLG